MTDSKKSDLLEFETQKECPQTTKNSSHSNALQVEQINFDDDDMIFDHEDENETP